jgi:hypothetical protein
MKKSFNQAPYLIFILAILTTSILVASGVIGVRKAGSSTYYTAYNTNTTDTTESIPLYGSNYVTVVSIGTSASNTCSFDFVVQGYLQKANVWVTLYTPSSTFSTSKTHSLRTFYGDTNRVRGCDAIRFIRTVVTTQACTLRQQVEYR